MKDTHDFLRNAFVAGYEYTQGKEYYGTDLSKVFDDWYNDNNNFDNYQLIGMESEDYDNPTYKHPISVGDKYLITTIIKNHDYMIIDGNHLEITGIYSDIIHTILLKGDMEHWEVGFIFPLGGFYDLLEKQCLLKVDDE